MSWKKFYRGPVWIFILEELVVKSLTIAMVLTKDWLNSFVIILAEETVAETNKQMNGNLPFAVVGSNDFVKVGNKMVRARQYPWGVVQGW